MFGDKHPCIMSFNTNLITCYSMDYKTKGDRKEIISKIIERNYKIATDAYGMESIHLLYQISCYLINKIAIQEI